MSNQTNRSSFAVGDAVRLAFDGVEPIPFDEQLTGVVSSLPSNGFEAQIVFDHEGESCFDFWPLDELAHEPRS